MKVQVAVWLLVVAAAVPLAAQWKIAPGEGSLDLKAPAPKAADGKPDLSGIWEQENLNHFRNLAADMKAAEVPFRPEAKALFDSRQGGARGHEEPDANCLPQGVPKIDGAPVPFKIVQTPKLVLIVYEAFNLWRQVHLDGRQLLNDPNPTWLGYSSGKWDGDTLVVETTGFNGKAWLDTGGMPASDALHVTERFRRVDFGHIQLDITIDDPKMYTRPWTAKETLKLVTGYELIEFICLENEKDLLHMNK
jgi:hypothetical protein